MPAFLAGKFGVFTLCVLAVFAGGFYVGYRWELPKVDAAKLQLGAQVRADEQAAATANAQAAEVLAAAKLQSDSAVSVHQGALSAMQGAEADRRTAIATQAAKAGQDGAVAPVLEAVHDMLAGTK